MGNCLSGQDVSTNKKFVDSRASVEVLKSSYKIDLKVLGSGSFGRVFLAQNIKDPSSKMAVKVMKKQHMSPEDVEGLHREIALMQ